MILSKNIKIKITSRNLKFYKKKGINCNIGDIINCPLYKLSLGSHSILEVKCDYCGKNYNINYNNYNKKTKNGILPSCCDNVDCMKKKRILSTQEIYGVDNVFQVENIIEKIKDTNIERYGVENPYQNEKIKLKAEKTNLKRYGVKNPFQSEEIKTKIKKTNFKNYGFDYPIQNKEFYNKNLKNGFKLTYIDLLSCQGSYEKDFVLKYKDKIKIENGLSLEYNYLGDKKVYHSDFYLPDYNLVVEIKSCYWYAVHKDQCDIKEKYSKKKYNYIMILDKDYTEFEKIVKI